MSNYSMKMYYTVSESEFVKAAEVLLALANGVLSEPENPRYRKLGVNDTIIESVLKKTPGGLGCLIEMGYILKENVYHMPDKIPTGKIMKVKLDLKTYYDQILLRNTLTNVSEEQSPSFRVKSLKSIIPHPYTKSELELFVRLSDSFDRMVLYEEILKNKRVWTGPVEENTRQKMEELKLNDSQYKDVFLYELLSWFKYSFFSWVDSPECDCCGQSKLVDHVEPTFEEQIYGASRVELYKCQVCASDIRFPRYNNPLKLLETRKGRCGEWANCFAFICRSVGFETRYISANFDHVWVEVYSENQQRWLHCDPCENICDKPLIYEKGWGRDVKYIFAFSFNNIQDVTWKYSANHKGSLAKRKDFNEIWLVKAINKLREERFKLLKLSPDAQFKVLKLTVEELVEMLEEKSAVEDEKHGGRTTGSLEWRMARGEVGNPPTFVPHTITLETLEREHETFELMYNSAKDLYKRFTGSYIEVSNWKSLIYSYENIFRKVEKDWKKVYLCRMQEKESGFIMWKIDLSLVSRVVRENLLVYVTSTTYHNGTIEWTLSNDSNVKLTLTPNTSYDLKEFKDSSVIILMAKLSGGQGENAWQHAQLFRQDFNSKEDSFYIKFRTREINSNKMAEFR